jgi:hypothetical protein
MIRVLLWTLVALMCVGGVSQAQQSAQFYTGSKLLALCKSISPSERSQCVGFVAGALDVHATYQNKGAVPRIVCVPVGVALGELVDIVAAFLMENRQSAETSAATLVLTAVQAAWPCQTRR